MALVGDLVRDRIRAPNRHRARRSRRLCPGGLAGSAGAVCCSCRPSTTQLRGRWSRSGRCCWPRPHGWSPRRPARHSSHSASLSRSRPFRRRRGIGLRDAARSLPRAPSCGRQGRMGGEARTAHVVEAGTPTSPRSPTSSPASTDGRTYLRPVPRISRGRPSSSHPFARGSETQQGLRPIRPVNPVSHPRTNPRPPNGALHI